MLAHCAMCARPCCRDCTVEMVGDYFCETCKVIVTMQLQTDKVVPEAARTVYMGVASIFILGALLGPYTIWRGREAAELLDRFPWMRGRWHIRAGFVLGGFGAAISAISLAERYLL